MTVIENKDSAVKVAASAAAEQMAAVGNMEALKASRAFDKLMGQIDRGEIELDGKDGFIQHYADGAVRQGVP
ncbi:hypothetical protein IV500_14010 [Paeniglutamicibacter antarcticus]|uniref:Uncharacterized protein n=1 Tax=Arthrobacter terrae TaxID=2935737 RepID=A0A931CS75_9MICC|nr:hypothetical protein [Arthrobacter terrae]